MLLNRNYTKKNNDYFSWHIKFSKNRKMKYNSPLYKTSLKNRNFNFNFHLYLRTNVPRKILSVNPIIRIIYGEINYYLNSE